MKFSGLRLIFLLLIGLVLSSCATLNDPEASQEFKSHEIGQFSPEQSFGQTIYSRRPNFNRIQLWLQITDDPNEQAHSLIFELFQDNNQDHPLRTLSVPLNSIKKSFPLSIYFDPVVNSSNKNYYLQMKTTGGVVKVFGRNEDQYPFGQALINHQPQFSDAAFRLGYRYGLLSFYEDLIDFFKGLPYFILLGLSIWVPGRFLLMLTGLERKFDWGGRVALSIGISLSFIAVLVTWTSQFGFKWNSFSVWFFVIMIALLMGVMAINRNRGFINLKNIHFGPKWFLNILLLLIFIFSLSIRLIMVRDLATPAWVDSVHHALIGRLIYETGAIPQSYSPLLNIQTANYHSGFHSNFAFFLWLSGLDIPKALLIFGQFLNALMVFSSYLFAITFTRSRLAGILAALATGVFTPMPAYFTSWGRYTQLAGLVILPASFALLYFILNQRVKTKIDLTLRPGKPNSLATFLLAGLVCGGLFLTHYRVMVFLAALVLSFLLISLFLWAKKRKAQRWIVNTSIYIFLLTLISIGFSYPWWPSSISTLFKPSLVWGNVTKIKVFSDFSWSLLTSASGIYILVISGAGMAWAIWKREIFPWIFIIWVSFLFFFANLGALGLPLNGFVNNMSVTISLFLPIACLFGYLLGWIIDGWGNILPSRVTKYYQVIVFGIFTFLSFFAAPAILTIINPTTIISRHADLEAIDWLNYHLPRFEKVLINPFSWGYGIYAGGDGGYWISAITNHPTDPPPVLYGLDVNTSTIASEMSQNVIQTNGNPEKIYQMMVSKDIKYLFLGAKGGIFSPQAFLNSPLYQNIYSENGTWIFKVKEP